MSSLIRSVIGCCHTCYQRRRWAHRDGRQLSVGKSHSYQGDSVRQRTGCSHLSCGRYWCFTPVATVRYRLKRNTHFLFDVESESRLTLPPHVNIVDTLIVIETIRSIRNYVSVSAWSSDVIIITETCTKSAVFIPFTLQTSVESNRYRLYFITIQKRA